MKDNIQATPASEHVSASIAEQKLATVSHLSQKTVKPNAQGLKPCKIALALGKFSSFIFYVAFVIECIIIENSILLLFMTHFFGLVEEVQQSKGFITFSLSNGPEYHLSQVCLLHHSILLLFFCLCNKLSDES